MAPDPYYQNYQNSVYAALGGIGSYLGNYIPPVRKLMKRARHKYLYSVAEEIVAILESKEVLKDEGCEIRALVEKIWDMEKEKGAEK